MKEWVKTHQLNEYVPMSVDDTGNEQGLESNRADTEEKSQTNENEAGKSDNSSDRSFLATSNEYSYDSR